MNRPRTQRPGHRTQTSESRADLPGASALPSSVLLCSGVDLENQAVTAAELLGFGIIVVGPVSLEGVPENNEPPQWNTEKNNLIGRGNYAIAPDAVFDQLTRQPRQTCGWRLIELRISRSGAKVGETLSRLAQHADGFLLNAAEMASMDAPAAEEVRSLVLSVENPILVLRITNNQSSANELLQKAIARLAPEQDSGPTPRVWGIAIDCDAQTPTEQFITEIRLATQKALGRQPLILSEGLVESPGDAAALYNAGIDIVGIDGRWTAAGPGLPKRINQMVAESLLPSGGPSAAPEDLPVLHASWFWHLILGLALLIGGGLATGLGLGKVLLPYDEQFLNATAEELCGFSDQLLPFMSHDRVTLAGTMLALGILYASWSLHGDRRGLHWARVSMLASSFTGFLSFFLFLGFGYFDPFHAFITAVMLQFVVAAARSRQTNRIARLGDFANDGIWKRALWGQLLTIIHGAGILGGGLVICWCSVTGVFVEDDLLYLRLTAEQMNAVNPRLVPLVAHDRAAFGGMLCSTGIAVTLCGLWGWGRGRAWLGRSMLCAGMIGYGFTIFIHFAVGYTSFRHLLPAYAGLFLNILSLALAGPWLFAQIKTSTRRPSR